MLAAGAVAFEAPAVPFFTTDTRELVGASSSEGRLPDELSRFALPMATDRLFGDLHDVLGEHDTARTSRASARSMTESAAATLDDWRPWQPSASGR